MFFNFLFYLLGPGVHCMAIYMDWCTGVCLSLSLSLLRLLVCIKYQDTCRGPLIYCEGIKYPIWRSFHFNREK